MYSMYFVGLQFTVYTYYIVYNGIYMYYKCKYLDVLVELSAYQSLDLRYFKYNGYKIGRPYRILLLSHP